MSIINGKHAVVDKLSLPAGLDLLTVPNLSPEKTALAYDLTTNKVCFADGVTWADVGGGGGGGIVISPINALAQTLVYNPDTTTAISPLINYNKSANSIHLGVTTGSVAGLYNVSLGTSNMQLAGASATNNFAVGDRSLNAITTGSNNVAIGSQSLFLLNSGGSNIAIGPRVMRDIVGPVNFNVAMGSEALMKLTSGVSNVAIGEKCLTNTLDSTNNTCMGATAMQLATGSCSDNTVIGTGALKSVLTGSQQNVCVGGNSCGGKTTVNNSCALGEDAGLAAGTCTDSILIGQGCARTSTAITNSIVIGNIMSAAAISNQINIGNTQTSTYIAGIRGRTTAFADGIACLIDSMGQLGTVSSSIALKENIATISDIDAMEWVAALNPCRFNYKSQPMTVPGARLNFGMMAEEVHEVCPDMVVYDADGKPETIQYQHLPIILLAELKRQQTEIFDLWEEIADLKKAKIV